MLLNEQDFRLGWKVLCALYKSKNAHALKEGCGKETLFYWIRDTYECRLRSPSLESPRFYKAVLRLAETRGWCKRVKKEKSYRAYKFYC